MMKRPRSFISTLIVVLAFAVGMASVALNAGPSSAAGLPRVMDPRAGDPDEPDPGFRDPGYPWEVTPEEEVVLRQQPYTSGDRSALVISRPLAFWRFVPSLNWR